MITQNNPESHEEEKILSQNNTKSAIGLNTYYVCLSIYFQISKKHPKSNINTKTETVNCTNEEGKGSLCVLLIWRRGTWEEK